jgi:hypothetical protein
LYRMLEEHGKKILKKTLKASHANSRPKDVAIIPESLDNG